MEPCVHCKKNRQSKPRGLCFPCFQDRSIRCQYATATGREAKREPTEEELNAMIEEGYRNLPAWWYDERCQAKGVGDLVNGD